MSKKILVSGVKPTGRPHIGNYFGAMKQFIDYQEEYECYIFIPDLHALTSLQDGKALRQATEDVFLDYLAIGLDPRKVTIYKQSDIHELGELQWIFNCLSTMPYLMRAHAFKDAEAKNKEINVGTFTYPLLMAADILIQDADVVPVGQDQKQHIEIARDMADKFNSTFDELFVRPKEMIREDVAIVPGTDGQKMSKSYGNTIGLFATDEEIRKAVMGITTDSKGVSDTKDPDSDNVFRIHKLFANTSELSDLSQRYTAGKIGYKESKEILVDRIISFVSPLRAKREEISKDMAGVKKIMSESGEKAKERARIKMEKIRTIVGLD